MFIDKNLYVGIDLGGTSVKLGIIDDAGNIIAKQEASTPRQKYEETLDLFVELIQETGISLKEIKGIGIGVPGFVDVEKGTIANLVNVGWKNVSLKDDLEKKLGIPVVVDNDANLAALGEVWQGAARGAKNIICITIGTGIGSGIIIDGKIYHGKNALAGEIGHLPINPLKGNRCNCGKLGCLETESSATAILNYALRDKNHGVNTIISDNPTTKDIFDAAKSGDKVANEAINNAAYYLGLALSQISHALAPEKILIGGGVSKAKEQILNPIKDYFQQFSLTELNEQTEIVLAELENDAGIFGAVYNAIINLDNR